jgi:4-hydroxybenzoate polyprenyltransferase
LSQFVTIAKTDKQFWPMLTGRFSKTHFAQPVRNLYINSANETVTFKLIEKKSFTTFQALVHWYSLTRNIYLIFPIVGGLSYLIAAHGIPSYELIVSSILSLQFFLLALTLYNDYNDYVQGTDRINENNSSRPLMQGLMRPYQALQLSYIFLFLSFGFASYCFLVNPITFLFALLALFVGSLQTINLFGKAYKVLSLLTAFLLAGPLLVIGFEYLLYDQVTLPSILLGFLFGLHALKYDFCKQVKDIFYNSKAKVKTISTFFGFERSKILYSLISCLHILILTYFAYLIGKKEIYLLVLIAFCFEFYINKVFYGAASFLSSNINSCMSLQKLHYTIECSLIVFIFISPLWLSLI